MTETQTDRQGPVFKDRKTGLVLFGLVHVGIGCLCALLVPLMLLGMVMSKTVNAPGAAPMDARMMIPGILIYVALAVWFIWMGVGSILAKRWARALFLATSWIWLVGGVGGILMLWVILPDIYAQLVAQGQMPQTMATVMLYVTFGFTAVCYVFFPFAMILFYGGPNVKATCEFRNPDPAWTDSCPLPVLATSLVFALWAFSVLFMGCYNWAMPFFGLFLSGTVGAAAALVISGAFACAAWGTYRLKLCAWSGSVILVLVWALSIGLTFTRHSLLDFYAQMKFPEQQLELMKPFCTGHNASMAAFGAVWLAALLGYLLFTRRYFPRDAKLGAAGQA